MTFKAGFSTISLGKELSTLYTFLSMIWAKVFLGGGVFLLVLGPRIPTSLLCIYFVFSYLNLFW